MIKLVDSLNQILDLNNMPDFGIRWDRSMQGTASFANNYKKIPNYDKMLYLGTDYGIYEYEIVLTTNNLDLKNVSQAQDLLTAFLFNEEGRPKRLKMYFDYEISPEVRFRFCRLGKHPEISLGEKFHNLTMTFVTEDRYSYGDTIHNSTITIPSLNLTGVNHILTPAIKGYSVAPEITISGNAQGVHFKSFNKVLNVGTIESGSVYTIDLERYHAVKGNQDVFLRIPLRYSIGEAGVLIYGTSGNITVTFRWQNRYI